MPRHRLGCGLVVGAVAVLAACSRNRGRGDVDASASAASPVAQPAVSSSDGGDTGGAARPHWEWDGALDTALARQLTAPYQQPILTALDRDCTGDFGMIADARIQADLAFAADGGVTTVRAFGGTDRLQGCVVRSLSALRPVGSGGTHLVTLKFVVPRRARRQAPRTGAPESPVAADLCGSLHGIASRRKAECCREDVAADADERSRGPVRAACVQLLSDMLADRTVEVDPDKVQACRRETVARYERCDAIGVNEQRPPASCLEAVSGKVALGGPCRSALECRDGLLCEGNTLLFGNPARNELGRCARPAPDGEACLVSGDNVSTTVRPSPINLIAGCAHRCTTEHRCAPFVATGAACLISASCGERAACVGERCAAALPGRGGGVMMRVGRGCAVSGGFVWNRGERGRPARRTRSAWRGVWQGGAA